MTGDPPAVPAPGPAPTGPAPALRIRGLARAYGATPVLVDADLDVPTARVVALLGPSGCGKTTLVRLVAGFDRPDAGTIELAGRVVARGGGSPLVVAPESRRVGVVPQEGALFSHLDVAGNVGFGLPRGGRTPDARRRVEHMLDLVGLSGLAGRRPDQLSGGQQQRVAVARALAPGPDLVCLDEPFSALDASLRSSVRDAVMGALRAESATALLVTHDQDEALSVADTVAVMLDGRIAQVGSPEQVYARPASVAVARFVGEAVLLEAHGEGDAARCELGILRLARPATGPVTVLLRPEQLLLTPLVGAGPGDVDGPDAGSSSESTLGTAQVTDLSFHGHDALVGLRTPSGTALHARLSGGWLPRPGQPVALGLRGTGWPLAG